MRASIVAAMALGLCVSTAYAQQKETPPPYRVVTENELPALLKSRPDIVVVDARMPMERGNWGLACERCSTVQAPFDFGSDEKSAAAGLKAFSTAVAASRPLQAARAANREVVVVCLAGGRSAAAAGELHRQGFKAVLLDGGLQGLRDAANIKGSKPK